MNKITIPGQNVPMEVGGNPINPDWYKKLQFLELLQPLSDIPVTTAVSSIDTATGAITLGYGLARSAQAIRSSLTSITASLSGDVALNNTGAYFDGPGVAQGTTGTWFVSGTVTVLDPSNSGNIFNCKLWDGTTVIASSAMRPSLVTGGFPIGLSGIITSPAGNLRISCQAATFNTGLIRFNSSGNAKDSTITAVRIA